VTVRALEDREPHGTPHLHDLVAVVDHADDVVLVRDVVPEELVLDNRVLPHVTGRPHVQLVYKVRSVLRVIVVHMTSQPRAGLFATSLVTAGHEDDMVT